MKNNNTCILCGKLLRLNQLLCTECDSLLEERKDTVDYGSTLEIIPSNTVGPRILTFFQDFFARQDVINAYELYTSGLSDEPSQSHLSELL